MEGKSSSKFCVICGVEKGSGWEGEGELRSEFSKDVKLVKFCGELELSSGLSGGDGGFTAYNFLRQLDKCSDFVRVCEGCSSLISETVDKRVELEGVECEVLELQIKLLVKLKELEGCSKLYLQEMGMIMERVKGSQLYGLERRDIFGNEKGKCDVLGFRGRILNVGTSLGIFVDQLNSKISRKRDLGSKIPEENVKQVKFSRLMEESPPRFFPSMEDDDDFDNFPLSSLPHPDSPVFNDDHHKTTEQTLEELKMETDHVNEQNEIEGDSRLNVKVKSDKPKIDKSKLPYVKKKVRGRVNRKKLSHINWKGMGPIKCKLIETILVQHHSTVERYDNRFVNYKWSYDVPTNKIQFADFPIEVTESENDNDDHRLGTLSCTSCTDGDPNGFKISFKFPTNLNKLAFALRKTRGVQFLKQKIFDHVLSFHLNLFNCSLCNPEEAKKFKLTSLRQFQEHQKLHSDQSNFCEICGIKFAQKKSLQKHLDRHAMKQQPEEAEKMKKFQCATCGKKFYENKNLLDHEESHKPKEQRAKVTCSFCGKEVLKRCYLNHKKNFCPQQSIDLKMSCEICGKSYKNGKSLGDHLVRTHRLPERPKF